MQLSETTPGAGASAVPAVRRVWVPVGGAGSLPWSLPQPLVSDAVVGSDEDMVPGLMEQTMKSGDSTFLKGLGQ